MSNKTKFLTAVGASLILSCASFAQAEWASLDSDNSRVSFVSTKLKDISEIHFFESMSGSISDDGAVTIAIDAASINSGIEIRDTRMKEFLFAVVDYPQIAITANIDLDSLSEGVSSVQVPATLSVAGAELAVSLDTYVSVSDSSVIVSSAKPVIVYAAQVGLTEGVAKLAELAGGIAVGGSVPVSFSLAFDR